MIQFGELTLYLSQSIINISLNSSN